MAGMQLVLTKKMENPDVYVLPDLKDKCVTYVGQISEIRKPYIETVTNNFNFVSIWPLDTLLVYFSITGKCCSHIKISSTGEEKDDDDISPHVLGNYFYDDNKIYGHEDIGYTYIYKKLRTNAFLYKNSDGDYQVGRKVENDNYTGSLFFLSYIILNREENFSFKEVILGKKAKIIKEQKLKYNVFYYFIILILIIEFLSIDFNKIAIHFDIFHVYVFMMS